MTVWLYEGPHGGTTLPISGRNKNITLDDGSTYFRMTGCYKLAEDGTKEFCYLWDGWLDEFIAAKKAQS